MTALTDFRWTTAKLETFSVSADMLNLGTGHEMANFKDIRFFRPEGAGDLPAEKDDQPVTQSK
jgi:hypothetical protein